MKVKATFLLECIVKQGLVFKAHCHFPIKVFDLLTAHVLF